MHSGTDTTRCSDFNVLHQRVGPVSGNGQFQHSTADITGCGVDDCDLGLTTSSQVIGTGGNSSTSAATRLTVDPYLKIVAIDRAPNGIEVIVIGIVAALNINRKVVHAT